MLKFRTLKPSDEKKAAQSGMTFNTLSTMYCTFQFQCLFFTVVAKVFLVGT